MFTFEPTSMCQQLPFYFLTNYTKHEETNVNWESSYDLLEKRQLEAEEGKAAKMLENAAEEGTCEYYASYPLNET